MIQFYKKRDFGELISATFDFFKHYGKNYIRNFFLINGLFLILLVLVFWFGFGEIFQQLFSANTQGQQFFFEQYFTQNQGVLIGAGLLMFTLLVFLSLVNYSYPVLYMKRVAETGVKEITSSQMIDDIKNHLGKFFMFFLIIILLSIPVMILVGFVSVLLMMILIGFFLLIFIIPAIMNIINLTLFDHYHTDKGVINSLKYAWNAQFSKNFWKYWGSAVIVYILINIISSVFSFIPMMFMMGAMFGDPEGMNPETSTSLGLLIMLVYVISFVMSFILVNLLYINTGFMYYDSRADLHRQMQFSEIETLGTGEV